MPRKSRVDELREKFEAAIEKGLVSESAAERTQALRSAGDMLNPNLTDLQKQFKQAEDAREAAESALKTAQTALDAANAELGPLREQAAKFVTMETEYVDLKTNLDARIAAMRDELVAEAQRHSWDAQRSENSAKETLKTAQAQFGARGQQILLDEVKRIFEENHIAEPDPARLPKGISPLYLTLFGHSPIKAQLVMAFAKTFPEPTDGFKEALYKVLATGLPVSPTLVMPSVDEQLKDENAQPRYVYPELKEIPDLAERRAVLTAMATKFGCLQEIQDRVDQRRAEILAQQYQENTDSLHRQEQDLARKGYGRSEIGVVKPSPTSFTGECIDPANCCCPKHNGTPARFRNSLEGVVEQ
jgi:hypothetical protein